MKWLLTCLALCAFQVLFAQIKIGDNPQTLDPGSVLELESSNRALVITRLSTAEMNALSPLPGAIVYNLDEECIHYYNGSEWINLCSASALELTNFPIVNADTTIALTRTGDQINVEVGTITGLNIVDQSLTRDDYGPSSVNGQAHIQLNSTPPNRIIPSIIPNQILKTNTAADEVIWADPDVIAMGKVDGVIDNSVGATVLRLGIGSYNVSLTPPRPVDDYIIQLTVFGNNRIYV
ncbi:MAG: hypothetical protein KJP14_12700, partial [Eudoraea sp.]|nr:hypothetical protein [Eudoraea sp.]